MYDWVFIFSIIDRPRAESDFLCPGPGPTHSFAEGFIPEPKAAGICGGGGGGGGRRESPRRRQRWNRREGAPAPSPAPPVVHSERTMERDNISEPPNLFYNSDYDRCEAALLISTRKKFLHVLPAAPLSVSPPRSSAFSPTPTRGLSLSRARGPRLSRSQLPSRLL